MFGVWMTKKCSTACSMRWSFGVEYWSGIIFEWQMFLNFFSFFFFFIIKYVRSYNKFKRKWLIKAKLVIDYLSCHTDFGVECWSGVESNFEVANIFALRIINGPCQANLVLIAYASSEGSGEPAHPRSLSRTFAARSYKQWVNRNLQIKSQIPGPSKWLGMRS